MAVDNRRIKTKYFMTNFTEYLINLYIKIANTFVVVTGALKRVTVDLGEGFFLGYT